MRALVSVAFVAFAASACDPYEMEPDTPASNGYTPTTERRGPRPLTHPAAPPIASSSITLPIAGLPDWFVSGGARDAYTWRIDEASPDGDRPSLVFFAKDDPGGRYGTLMQSVKPDRWRGKRVLVSVRVKTQGVTGRGDFWARVQGVDSPTDGPGLASAATKLAPTSDFRRYDVQLDVPPNAAELQFGVGIAGPGRLWVTDAEVQDAPLTF